MGEGINGKIVRRGILGKGEYEKEERKMEARKMDNKEKAEEEYILIQEDDLRSFESREIRHADTAI